MKFPGAVKGCRIEINVIVDMGLVGVRTDKELILSLCPAHRRFITDVYKRQVQRQSLFSVRRSQRK